MLRLATCDKCRKQFSLTDGWSFIDNKKRPGGGDIVCSKCDPEAAKNRIPTPRLDSTEKPC